LEDQVALDATEKVAVVRKALALFFECEEEEIGNFVVGVERSVGGNAMFSGGWSDIPHWYLIGLASELVSMLEKQRESRPEQMIGRLDGLLGIGPDDLQRLREPGA
jgi:hypothetical protein